MSNRKNVEDNYRLQNALKELQSALRVMNTNYQTETQFYLFNVTDMSDIVFAHNGRQCSLTYPILIQKLKILQKELEEKNND